MFYDQKNAENDRTIRLSREDIRTARRLLGLFAEVDDSPLVDIPDGGGPITRRDCTAKAREDFHNRRRRGDVFGQSMFGEAAWDMLLALYVVDEFGRRQTVGSLMRMAGTPMTTAKRWLDFLTDHDLVRREPHPTDRRTAFVSLTDKARQKLDTYYFGTLKTGV